MNKTISLITVCALSTGGILTSCSEDTLNSSLSLPDDTPSFVTLGCKDAIEIIPVKAEGEWKATVVYDDAPNSENKCLWLGLLDNNGKGDSELNYVVDANNTTSPRSAKIVLTSGKESLEYTVTQLPVGTGDDNDDMDLSKFEEQIPIGSGLRMTNSKNDKLQNILLNQVYTLDKLGSSRKKVKELIDKFDLDPGSYYSSSTTPDIKVSLTSSQDIQYNSRLIGANLKVNVAYGIFKLNLNGDFRMFGSSTDSIVTFSTVSTPVLGSYTLRESKLNETVGYIMESEDQTEEDKAAALRLIFSNNFLQIRDSIENLVAGGARYSSTSSDAPLLEMLSNLDNNFGPAYIHSVGMGGSAELVYSTNYSNATDTMNIHGDMTLGLNAVLNLDVAASADYISKMQSRLKENSFQCRIKGGKISEASALINKFAALLSPDSKVDAKTVNEQLNTWVGSLTMDNATCVDYYPVPIWTLFSPNARKQLLRFFYDRYPNNNDNSCPYPFDVRAQIVNSSEWDGN